MDGAMYKQPSIATAIVTVAMQTMLYAVCSFIALKWCGDGYVFPGDFALVLLYNLDDLLCRAIRFVVAIDSIDHIVRLLNVDLLCSLPHVISFVDRLPECVNVIPKERFAAGDDADRFDELDEGRRLFDVQEMRCLVLGGIIRNVVHMPDDFIRGGVD